MNFKFALKVLFMVGSLGLVIYGMQKLRSPEFAHEAQKDDSALSLLLGADGRPMNWCVADVKTVEIYSEKGDLLKTLSEPKDISSVCEILIGGISKEAAEKSTFVRRLIAKDAKGSEKALEQAPGTAYFRFPGMPFSSPMLEKALQRLTQP